MVEADLYNLMEAVDVAEMDGLVLYNLVEADLYHMVETDLHFLM